MVGVYNAYVVPRARVGEIVQLMDDVAHGAGATLDAHVLSEGKGLVLGALSREVLEQRDQKLIKFHLYSDDVDAFLDAEQAIVDGVKGALAAT